MKIETKKIKDGYIVLKQLKYYIGGKHPEGDVYGPFLNTSPEIYMA